MHFIVALSKYYNQLRRAHAGYPEWSLPISASDLEMATELQRIYLLPTTTSPEYTNLSTKEKAKGYDDAPEEDEMSQEESEDDGVMLYTPVPLGRVSREEAKGMGVREAWMEGPSTPSTPTHSKKHHRHRSHSHVHQSQPSPKPRSHRHHRSVDATWTTEDRSL